MLKVIGLLLKNLNVAPRWLMRASPPREDSELAKLSWKFANVGMERQG
jgi:hypothetical protein